MAKPDDMIVPLLREMRAEVADFRASVEQRLDKIEGNQKSYKQAMIADTMMSKFMVGDFEERIHALENKVDALTKKR
jgi:DNA topoisomerase IA